MLIILSSVLAGIAVVLVTAWALARWDGSRSRDWRTYHPAHRRAGRTERGLLWASDRLDQAGHALARTLGRAEPEDDGAYMRALTDPECLPGNPVFDRAFWGEAGDGEPPKPEVVLSDDGGWISGGCGPSTMAPEQQDAQATALAAVTRDIPGPPGPEQVPALDADPRWPWLTPGEGYHDETGQFTAIVDGDES